MKNTNIEIRWHGRGGQGAITAAKIVAKAMFASGYTGVVMAPSFGTERRGAPVFTSLKVSRDKIYDLSPTTRPDIVVVLDHLLLKEADVTQGLKPGGLVVINTPLSLADCGLNGTRVAAADVTSLAVKAGLRQGIVNSGIIGAFARAAGLVDINLLLKNIEEEFTGRRPRENALAARLCYDNTLMGGS
ncbi:MAG: 2-oxoacid:acceptor oxidoreductase family protein [Desulfomonilia bacterium]|jgi:2-oxoacid:acceptor oxidoreductase gamma subunit (pyruvate/2-ketoisovalerate family)